MKINEYNLKKQQKLLGLSVDHANHAASIYRPPFPLPNLKGPLGQWQQMGTRLAAEDADRIKPGITWSRPRIQQATFAFRPRPEGLYRGCKHCGTRSHTKAGQEFTTRNGRLFHGG